MKDTIKTRDEIDAFISTKGFVELTCAQILKDLNGLSAFEPEFVFSDKDSVLEQLVRQLALNLEKIAESNNLLQFIYQVDLPENQYYNSIQKDDSYQNLAFLVIRREAQKVFLRNKYS